MNQDFTDDCAERKEYIRRYWKYYEILENDCVSLMRYISFDTYNYGAYSDEIIKQFLSICAEVDNVCKNFCGYGPDGRPTFHDYASYLLVQNNTSGYDIRNAKIILKINEDAFSPFDGWNVEHASELEWWNAYNQVKHHRTDMYERGNLGNLLTSLAALYFLECLKFIKISNDNSTEEKNIFDVPPNTSKLFYIEGLPTLSNVIGPELYGIM